MKYIFAIFIACILCFAYIGYAEDVQKTVVEGYFYPNNKEALKGMVDKFVEDAKTDEVSGEITTIIVPHAGYQYSGWVAGYAFKAIMNKPYNTVIVIVPSHHSAFDGLAVLDKDSYLTPLGKVTIDRDMSRQLIMFNKRIRPDIEPFTKEHAAEV